MGNRAGEFFRDRVRKRSWRYFLIEPFKQLKLGLYVIVISMTFTTIAAALIYKALTEQYKQVMEIFAVVDPNKQWELITNDVFFSNALNISLLFVSYLVILLSVVILKTHKVYGPLVSIERFVKHVTNGNYHAKVRMRDGDDLVELANKLNAMADALLARHGAADKRLLEAEALENDTQDEQDDDDNGTGSQTNKSAS